MLNPVGEYDDSDNSAFSGNAAKATWRPQIMSVQLTISQGVQAVQRILVSGISGAGKSTLAAQLSARLGIPYHELDAMHHGPGWVKRESFESDVHRFADQSTWISDDQYHHFLGDLLWQRADTVVWLNLPRRTVMWRVINRSLARVILRRRLWNDNRETWRKMVFDPTHPVRWAWNQHSVRRRETAERIVRLPYVRVVQLVSARQTRRWLRTLPDTRNPGSGM